MDTSTRATPRGSGRPTSASFMAMACAFCAGCVLLALACFFFGREYARARHAEENQLKKSLHLTVRALEDIQERCVYWTERVSTRLTGAGSEQSRHILEEFSRLWADANFTFYNQRGEVLFSAGPAHTSGMAPALLAPERSSAAVLLQDALRSGTATGISRLGDGPGVSAAAHVRGGPVRLVMVTAPLEGETLRYIEAGTGTRAGVIRFAARHDRAVGLLFSTLDPAAAEQLSGKVERLAAAGQPLAVALTLDGVTRDVGIIPLAAADGTLTGALAVVTAALPISGPESMPPHSPAWLLLVLSGTTLIVLGFLIRQRRLYAGWTDALAALPEMAAGQEITVEKNRLPDALDKRFQDAVLRLRQRFDLLASTGEKKGTSPHTVRTVASSVDRIYAPFFYNAVTGAFRCAPDGRFMEVNLAAAFLLGYESPALFLAAHDTLASLMGKEEARTALELSRDVPNQRHAVSLPHLQDGVRPYWLFFLPAVEETEEIKGFLLDREVAEQLQTFRYELWRMQGRLASLSLLLASTCLQSQSYFARNASKSGDRPGQLSGQGAGALKSVFDDIYRIAMAEADAASLIVAPVDLRRLMEKVYRQALPALGGRGMELSCAVAEGLDVRVLGSPPLLRHALLRCLFMLTAGLEGGQASISVRHDPNAPRLADRAQLIFTATWSAPDAEQPSGQLPDGPEEAAEERQALFREEPAGTNSGVTGLHMREERAVIEFLVHMMQGELLPNVFGAVSRSVEFIVQMDQPASLAQQPFAAPDRGSAPPVFAPISEEEIPAPDPLASMDDQEDAASILASPLSILVADPDRPGEVSPAPADQEPVLDILLVDDSRNNRLLFSLYLRDTRHRITEASNGREGVEAFRSRHFDLIFMDMEMPLMDGYQATRIIRAIEEDEGRAPTPIIAQTAYVLPEFRQECILSGCTDFLSKPFTKRALLTMIHDVIQLRGEGR